MSKQEFLEKLRLALNGRVSAGIVTENIRYYEDYINIETRKGRSEEDVLEQLGDPRLLARTIIQTQGSAEEKEQAADGNREPQRRFFNIHMQGRLFRTVTLVVFLLIVVLLLTVVFSVLSVALPVLLIILAVSFLVKLFRDWLN